MKMPSERDTQLMKAEELRRRYYISFWFPIALFLLATLVVWHFRFYSSSIEIEIELATPGNVQVFWDSGEGYSEAQSLRFAVAEAETPTQWSNPFDFTGVQSLRIDPADNDGLIDIYQFRLKYSGELFSRRYIFTEDMASSGIANLVADTRSGGLVVKPISGNGDPHFIISEIPDLPSLQQKIFNVILSLLVVAVLAAGISIFFHEFWKFVTLRFLVGMMYLEKQRQRFQNWCDAWSARMKLLNWISCLVFAIIIGLIAYWNAPESYQNQIELRFNLVDTETENVHLFYDTGYGINATESELLWLEEGQLNHNILITLDDLEIQQLRLDVLNRPGIAILEDFKVRRSPGNWTPLSFHKWDHNDQISIRDISENRLVFESKGGDPVLYFVHSDYFPKQHFQFPLPFFYFLLFGSIAFIATAFWNRLLSEGQDIGELIKQQNS